MRCKCQIPLFVFSLFTECRRPSNVAPTTGRALVCLRIRRLHRVEICSRQRKIPSHMGVSTESQAFTGDPLNAGPGYACRRAAPNGTFKAQLCLRTFLIFVLSPGPPRRGVPGGGSGRPFHLGNRGFWAGCGPDLEGAINFSVLVLASSHERRS